MGLGALTATVFPARCPGCGARAEPLCPACATGLRAPPRALPPPGVDEWAAAFAYEGVAREIVARVKYRSERAALPWLADATAAAARAAGLPGDDAVVTWAPTTRARRRARGFDHAALLAQGVARRLDLPVRRLLARTEGHAQTGLAAAARREGPRFVASAPPRHASGVLVVDDVATTGATLAAAAHALRSGGFATVHALTAARTPPRV